MYNIKQRAFTLAEVLVTICLLGVVAAATMPSLLASYRDHVFKTSYNSEVSKFAQAVDQMYANNELTNLQGTEDFVNNLQKEIKVVKVCKNNELDKCFPQEIKLEPNTYRFNSNFNMCSSSILARAAKAMNPPAENSEAAGILANGSIADIPMMMSLFEEYDSTAVILPSGASLLITFNPECQVKSESPFSVLPNVTTPKNKSITQCAAAIIDVNSSKGPNEFGKDIYYYNLNACNAIY